MGLFPARFRNYLNEPLQSAPLALFRFLFGIMLAGGVLRFWLHGWVEELYIRPQYYFYYYGFSWVHPYSATSTYLLFLVCGVSALFFALGLFYRISSVVLFLSFTWIELLDKTNYLNHYYFVTLVLFLMMWLPAHVTLSADSMRKPGIARRYVPRFTVGSIRLMMAIVYVYAGLAKLNSDWLVNAMPLRLWLPAKNDLPLIGPLLNEMWVAFFFSWFGAVYDLSIPFFLGMRATRKWAYAAVVVFHVATSILFPIGMFPYIMVLSALVFFDSADVDAFLQQCKNHFTKIPVYQGNDIYTFAPRKQQVLLAGLQVFFAIQLLFPWRYLLMPGELFWTEEGYRFSWRVMLMEKTGYAQFVVQDDTGKRVGVNNSDFLTPNQEKMMATQPDFLVQYAHLLHHEYAKRGMVQPKVTATVYVALNGRRSRLFVDPEVDLAAQTDGWAHKQWIKLYDDKIYGL